VDAMRTSFEQTITIRFSPKSRPRLSGGSKTATFSAFASAWRATVARLSPAKARLNLIQSPRIDTRQHACGAGATKD
jgi:hypothetical protein